MEDELGRARMNNLILTGEIAAMTPESSRLTFLRSFYIRRYLDGREPTPDEEAEIAEWIRFEVA